MEPSRLAGFGRGGYQPCTCPCLGLTSLEPNTGGQASIVAASLEMLFSLKTNGLCPVPEGSYQGTDHRPKLFLSSLPFSKMQSVKIGGFDAGFPLNQGEQKGA